MEITLKYRNLVKVISEDISKSLSFSEKSDMFVDIITNTYGLKLNLEDSNKLQKFYKLFHEKFKSSYGSFSKCLIKNEEWLKNDLSIEIQKNRLGRPKKDYDDLHPKSKKLKQQDIIDKYSKNEIKDCFKTIVTQAQPKEAAKIIDVLPTASPKRLKRIVQSISTPKTTNSFNEEEALALILNLGLSRNKYRLLKKATQEKSSNIFPGVKAIAKVKNSILPSPIKADIKGASIGLSTLLENTAARIISTFSMEDISLSKKCGITMICKWGCDGSSGFTEYNQSSGSDMNTNFSTIFMASLVPLRMRIETPSASNAEHVDIWLNSTPGSKLLCRPICFEYTKEDRNSTRKMVNQINKEISQLRSVYIEISGSEIEVSFHLEMTMIDGKVANAVTDTLSTWKCNICGKNSSAFHGASDDSPINKDALKFGLSPLHARIRFMEYCLHLAYDIKYRQTLGNENKSVRNNKEMNNMRLEEKKRIQDEFKKEFGLIIDQVMFGYGSSNTGNTARRFFDDPETTSIITCIDQDLVRRFKIILAVINSKKEINAEKFQIYANKTKELLSTKYYWRPITPTVHKILAHGKDVIQHSILPLGELTEEAQESRNRDVKQFRFFNTRKHNKTAQNMDLFQHLLLSSDPAISSIRSKWLPKISIEIEKDDVDANEINDLLSFDISDCFEKNQ